MTIDNFDTVFYTCIFLLPGFIIKSIIDTFIPPQKHNDIKYFFICLLYSIINCAILSWAYVLIYSFREKHLIIYWFFCVSITIVGAVIIAVFIGIVRKKEWIKRILLKLNISISNPIPNAWDYYFSKQNEAIWVIVTLKNGKEIYGLFGCNSFVSSDYEERDLYIEKVYNIDDHMKWIDNPQSKGILICKDEIETIEFLTGDDNDE